MRPPLSLLAFLALLLSAPQPARAGDDMSDFLKEARAVRGQNAEQNQKMMENSVARETKRCVCSFSCTAQDGKTFPHGEHSCFGCSNNDLRDQCEAKCAQDAKEHKGVAKECTVVNHKCVAEDSNVSYNNQTQNINYGPSERRRCRCAFTFTASDGKDFSTGEHDVSSCSLEDLSNQCSDKCAAEGKIEAGQAKLKRVDINKCMAEAI